MSFKVIITFITILGLTRLTNQTETQRFTIQIKEKYFSALNQSLRSYNFSLLFKVTPSVYIFQYHGDNNTNQTVQLILSKFRDQILAVEPVRVYKNTLNYVPAKSEDYGVTFGLTNIVCNDYYRTGVSKVWERNITGEGIGIAITDIGINTDLLDLEQAARNEVCNNFLTKTSDVTSENFPDLVKKAQALSNATTKNSICGADGIAKHATIYAIKMYEFPSHCSVSEVSPKLTCELDAIDICMNTWAAISPFGQLDLASRSIIDYGVKKGRHGRGTIYVVPAGPHGSELSNNIHTISVNSIGSFETNTYEIIQDASVLISGLRDGNNHTSTTTITSSDNKCEATLKGESAAVSQVSGIIALVLQANPALTIRDVQHLLVQASEYELLAETMRFKTNGANRHFHSIFGYGILNADKFVMLAQKHVPVPNLQSWTMKRYKIRTSRFYTQIYEFCYSCQVIRDNSCLVFVEHVTTTINFTTTAGRVKMEIISPSATHSTLMDLKIKKNETPLSRKGNLVSVHFWDEVAFGKWIVKIKSKYSTAKTKVHNVSLTLYGTRHASYVRLAATFMTQCGDVDIYGNSKYQEKRATTNEAKGVTSNVKDHSKLTDKAVSIIIMISVFVAALMNVIFCKLYRHNSNINLHVDKYDNFDTKAQSKIMIMSPLRDQL